MLDGKEYRGLDRYFFALEEELNLVTFASRLAECANSIALPDLPETAAHTAKRAIADTVGVCLAGSSSAFIGQIETAIGSDKSTGSSTKLGRAGKCSALDAALINGVSAHALDFDDCSTTLGGHPSAPIVPALFALGEQLRATGSQLLEAYIVGFETETHLARAVMPTHYEFGWHPTATLGIFGATAACGRLLKLNSDDLTAAFCIAASMACGLKSNFGTPVKPLHVGRAAQSGLLAALLAQQGYGANAQAFEHEHGFFKLFNGGSAVAPEKALGNWVEDLELLAPGISIKQHPCCGSAHSAIDAALLLFEQDGPINAKDVEQIDVWMHERRLAHTNRPFPKNALDAKFSVQFLTARALKGGAISIRDFSDDALMTSEVGALLHRVSVRSHGEDDDYFARLTVRMTDGTARVAEASTRLGRGQDNPMSDEELAQKFLDCCHSQLDEGQTSGLFEAFLHLAEVKDLSELTEILGVVDGLSAASTPIAQAQPG